MQIILSDEEIFAIHEALGTEIIELSKEVIRDERRGRDTKLTEKYLKVAKETQERFSHYVS